ncbi:MAG: hypothetical protein ACYS71_07590, partial [Planctomycetota bacterium]
MGFELEIFNDNQLQADYLKWLVEEYSIDIQRHFSWLWEYYANRMSDSNTVGIFGRNRSESGRWYVQAQECGLPSRITGRAYCASGGVFGGQAVKEVQRKEVVIENDIAWRINAAVDFLFGKPISFVCKSPDGGKRAEIESILKAVFSANGGIGFFQDMAMLGSVYGFVDCLARPGKEIFEHISSSTHTISLEDVLQLAQKVDLELIEAPRALPILEENDYRKIRCYVQHFHQKKNAINVKSSFLSRLLPIKRG